MCSFGEGLKNVTQILMKLPKQRRTGLFRKAEEALEEQRAATLKHLVTITILIESSIAH